MLIFDSRSLQTLATLEFLLLGKNLLLRKIGLEERKTLFGTDVGVPIKKKTSFHNDDQNFIIIDQLFIFIFEICKRIYSNVQTFR